MVLVHVRKYILHHSFCVALVLHFVVHSFAVTFVLHFVFVGLVM